MLGLVHSHPNQGILISHRFPSLFLYYGIYHIYHIISYHIYIISYIILYHHIIIISYHIMSYIYHHIIYHIYSYHIIYNIISYIIYNVSSYLLYHHITSHHSRLTLSTAASHIFIFSTFIDFSTSSGQSGANSSSATSTGTRNDPSGSSSSSTNQAWPKNNFAANAIAQAHAAAKMGNTSDPTTPQIPSAVGQFATQVCNLLFIYLSAVYARFWY